MQEEILNDEQVDLEDLEFDITEEEQEEIEKDTSISGYYITNERMMEELRISHEKDAVTDELAKMFQAIANKLVTKRTLTYRDKEDEKDCAQFGVLDCLKYWKSFHRNQLPVIDANGNCVYNEDGTLKLYQPKFNMELIPQVVLVRENKLKGDEIIVGKVNSKTYRVLVLNRDGTAKMISPNPFAYFTTVCTNGLGKGWGCLGYTDLPFAKRVYISDQIYSI